MKEKICISMDPETLLKIKEKVREGSFRNKSHVVEFAIKKLVEEVGK